MATRIEMNPNERLICVAARLLEDSKNYFAGGGLPLIAFTLAQRRYAPDITYKPSRRFGGPGGATAIASCCWRTIYLTQLQPRKFVEKVDHISSPGYLDGSPGARERAGLPRGTGPYRVVTTEAIFGFDDETRRMKLLAIAEGMSTHQVLDQMGFEPLVADRLDSIPEVTQDEVSFLRREIFARLKMDVQTLAL
jgi:acyl CoA:acetate/3-ketoacid CoA transferase beta subunit